jgi:hypothetical protein
MSWRQSGPVVIGKTGAEHVSISIAGRPDTEGWIEATLEVAAGVWTGRCEVWFHEGELRQFASEIERLYNSLTGTAELNPLEPYLGLKLTGDGKGHIVVDGSARDRLHRGATLTFRFELDQTELPAIAAALRAADPN